MQEPTLTTHVWIMWRNSEVKDQRWYHTDIPVFTDTNGARALYCHHIETERRQKEKPETPVSRRFIIVGIDASITIAKVRNVIEPATECHLLANFGPFLLWCWRTHTPWWSAFSPLFTNFKVTLGSTRHWLDVSARYGLKGSITAPDVKSHVVKRHLHLIAWPELTSIHNSIAFGRP